MTTPLDVAEHARRELVSGVKRLRVLATSDAAHGNELADALVGLTASRLLAWDFAEAAVDAPEAVVMAARILARSGAAGPYVSPADASRYFSASALLAAVQTGLGHQEAAGRTLAGVDGWLGQLGRLRLREHLEPGAVIWALTARARSVLATDPAAANALSDAAANRLYAESLDTSPGYLALTVHLLVADCRWAAGLTEEALAHHRLALAAYRRVVGPEGSRLRPGTARIALIPVAALHEPYARRLESLGQTAFAIAVRRAEVAQLERFGEGSQPLPAARARLADSLSRDGRAEPADATVTLAAPTRWTALSASDALAPDDQTIHAATRLERDVQAAVLDGVAAGQAAEGAEADLRAAAELAAAEGAAERAAAEAEALAAAASARSAALDQERQDAREASARREAEQAAARTAADERRRRLAEEHSRRLAGDPAAAVAAAAELAAARDGVRGAGADLAILRRATEHLADLLRPLAGLEPEAYLPELIETLESLVGLRWRLGEVESSREAAREARTLATGR